MATDADRALRGMLRTGTVSAVYPKTDTVRVVFDDKDETTSPELHVLHRFSGKNKDYWMPDIGDQVLCIFNNNDKNFSTGWVLGSYFTERQPPQVASADIMRMDFADGSFVEVNRAAGSLKINFTGPITINGSTINLN
ncbi:phage baseplate assembly protein V [Selenomonas ruminantium]|uniref:phage baseplate assembly protein V n=1 Tax=Selenomonas ruminantium TaxID=971 RepID=UPI0026ECF2EB|nr:phage baseplate assembly protein V [Selenomonas ruminantium]